MRVPRQAGLVLQDDAEDASDAALAAARQPNGCGFRIRGSKSAARDRGAVGLHATSCWRSPGRIPQHEELHRHAAAAGGANSIVPPPADATEAYRRDRDDVDLSRADRTGDRAPCASTRSYLLILNDRCADRGSPLAAPIALAHAGRPERPGAPQPMLATQTPQRAAYSVSRAEVHALALPPSRSRPSTDCIRPGTEPCSASTRGHRARSSTKRIRVLPRDARRGRLPVTAAASAGPRVMRRARGKLRCATKSISRRRFPASGPTRLRPRRDLRVLVRNCPKRRWTPSTSSTAFAFPTTAATSAALAERPVTIAALRPARSLDVTSSRHSESCASPLQDRS